MDKLWASILQWSLPVGYMCCVFCVCVCVCVCLSKSVGGAERVGLVSTHPHSKGNIEVTVSLKLQPNKNTDAQTLR